MINESVLHDMLSGRIVIACIGNELRGDDGFGPLMARLIEATGSAEVVDCGETPENYLGVIARSRPEKVIVLDAADFGGKTGEVRIVKKSEIDGAGVSTHAPILTMFADYIENQTGAQTYFLAIQPKTTAFGRPLSDEVRTAAGELAAQINRILDALDPA
jgi:hydrogenase 3 maturation protease